MTHEQRARNLLMEIWDAPDRETGIALLAAAFAEVKSDTLRDAENAAFEALTRHGFTGARYCVIAAIRGLIDTPTEPAAPDPTKALTSALKGMIAEFEKFSRYGSPMARDANEAMRAAKAALRLAENGG